MTELVLLIILLVELLEIIKYIKKIIAQQPTKIVERLFHKIVER